MALHRIAAAVGLAGLLILTLPTAAEDIPATSDSVTDSDYFHLNRLHGDGYSLLVPANATVKAGTNGVGIRGPKVAVEDADGNSTSDDAYFLSIRVYDNPDDLSAEAFATQAAQALWDKATAENAPTGALPEMRDGQIAPSDSAHLTIAGEPAFEVTYNAFDSLDRRIYIAHGDEMFSINYRDMSGTGVPLEQVQLDVYALLLSTLQLED